LKAVNLDEVRGQFPITSEWMYFDAASLSPYCIPVLRASGRFEKERTFGGSLYYDEWYEKIEKGRTLAARLVGADEKEIAFTKNTSEGVNLVTLLMDFKKGDNVVLTDLDFTANIYPFANLKDKGVDVKYIKSDAGKILPEDVEREIDENTKLVSLSHVLYRTGYRLDIEEIGAICREKGVHFHVDGTQSLGALPMDVKKANIDFLSVAGFKWLLSPLGTGFFFASEEFLDRSPVLGWQSVKNPFALDPYNFEIQDSAKRFEIGTLDMGAFLGMTAALEFIDSIGVEEIEKTVLGLSSFAVEELKGMGLDVLSDFEKENASGIVSFTNPRIKKTDLLDNKIIATLRDYVRLSPHIYNTKGEISNAVGIIASLRR
jgi:selenocysteine lyase/cysteine desulfurase